MPLLHLFRRSLIGEVTIPRTSEVAITPGPLFLARREMMAGHMQHTAMGIILVAALEIILRVDCHITGRHEDILVV